MNWIRDYKSLILLFVLVATFFLLFVLLGHTSDSFSLTNVGNLEARYKDYKHGRLHFAGEVILKQHGYEETWIDFEREYSMLIFNIPQLMLYHKRAEEFFPAIEKELKLQEIPDDFKYLVVAESALKIDNRSSAGAYGLRQFMPKTAGEYGLHIDKYVDERLDVEKSTRAAIDYLLTAHAKFNNWTLVAASFNRGMYGIQSALDAQKVTNYYDLVLPLETERYIYRILAIKYAMEDFSSYFSHSIFGPFYQHIVTDSVVVSGAITNLVDRSLVHSLTYKQLKMLNPWIVGNSLPEGEWKLKIFSLE